MAVKNIEMNYRNESGYDVLYPESILENIVDWQDSIYSKSEVDGQITTLQSSGMKFTSGKYKGTREITDTTVSSITTSLNQIYIAMVYSVSLPPFQEGGYMSNDAYYFAINTSTGINKGLGLSINKNKILVGNTASNPGYFLNYKQSQYSYFCFGI